MTNYESNQSTIFNVYQPLNNYRNSVFSFSNYTNVHNKHYDAYYYVSSMNDLFPQNRRFWV